MLDGWASLDTLIADGPRRSVGPTSVTEAFVEALKPAPPRAWRATARPDQLAVADSKALYTLYLAGRGAGKTHTASNTLAEWANAEPGIYGVVAPTFSDCRALCVEGPSGLLRALGDDLESYDKSKYELRLKNGSIIIMASDEAPKRLRGPNFTAIWGDEIGSWRNVKETWEEGIEFATRISHSRRLLTGTPKRGHPLVREFHDRAIAGDPDVHMVRARTIDNAANLSAVFLRNIRSKYEGTTLGRAELNGELLMDAEGALMTSDLIESTRVRVEHVPELWRVIVAVDPAVTSRPESDHCGIVVIGIGPPPLYGYLGAPARVAGPHLYVLADESVQATPRSWAERVLKTAEQWAADGIVIEVNQGGDLCTTMIQMVAESDGYPLPHLIDVRASVGKRTRAEPVAGVFEQHRIHIVGAMTDLEDQLAGWTPGDSDSPDQLDAFTWGAAGLMPELMVGRSTRVALLN